MKYSDLISFNPIEDVIQLTTADDANRAKEYVKSYVMSDTMAANLKSPVLDQLQMDEVVDNKGVLVVGNYGTGKSHLMSVISSIAKDADNLQYLQNKNFAKEMECIAGKFEVLRIEIGGVTMSLREILFGFIEDDFAARGIDFEVPDFDTVRDNKKLIRDMMMAFSAKYPDKGYLIVVDEFLSYLTSRDERQIVLDLEFFRALGEMCSKSKLRVIFGVQEKIFDNPRFSFVSDTLKHVSDRFTQIVITKEATSYVVSERILKKTPEQKALIRKHLEKFSMLYTGMSSRMDEFVDLFPIHPSYIDVFNKIYLIENRHILKNISMTIRDIFNRDVPENEPGIISFDNYWPAIKSNGLLKSDVTINRVVTASGQLEDIINRAFPKAAYKPLAIKIIYALSVHRLTTNGLDVHFGLTAENLKDDLCLFLPMPEQDADFLLALIKTTLKDIMTTVSGQFIIYNDANNQYYIDVDKVVDYDEKIKQKASIMADGELNRYFYQLIYSCLDWDAKQYVPGFEIYQRDLNWDSHNIFREGYLFLGLPGERSTAQPERDFYIHIMPPYSSGSIAVKNLEDEVYFFFKSTAEFKEILGFFSAANAQAQISEGKDKDAYLSKAAMIRKKLIKYLSENKNTCFDIQYKGQKRQMIEVLRGRYNRDMDFKDTVDLAASLCLDEYFCGKYPDCPMMKTKVTRKNMAENVRQAFDYFAGRKTQTATLMLQSFGVLDGDKIRPEGSKYAAYYIDRLKQLPPQGVINYSDIFDVKYDDQYEDKHFKINYLFTPIIFLSMVYAGYATMTLRNGTVLSASNLDTVPRISVLDLYEFKYLARPAQMAMAELKKLFDVVTGLMREGKVAAAYTPTYGGVAEAILKMTMGNDIGFTYAGDVSKEDIFGYHYGAFVLELTGDAEVGTLLGTTGGKAIVCGGESIALEEIFAAYENKLEEIYPMHTAAEEKKEIPTFTTKAEGISYHAKTAVAKPRVLIPVFPGTNCEFDSAKAVERAGAEANIFVINNLSAAGIADSIDRFAKEVKQAQTIFIPGGFSGGDEPDGSGKFITAFFRNPEIKEAVTAHLKEKDGLMIGICNGFQALIKLGLVPYGEIIDTDETCPTLSYNTISRHQSKIVRVRVATEKSPWLTNVKAGDIFSVPISHGEGRILAADQLVQDLAAKGQILTQYVDENGLPTNDIQFNPNGSTYAIEGLISPDGRVLGKMGHAERIGDGLYQNVAGNYDMKLFKSMVEYFK